MSSSINLAMLIGRLGRDPETKNLAGGSSVCNFSIATDETWKDKNGEKQERTDWHNVVCWNKLAEICSKYLHKGSLVYVEGKLQTRTWEKDGARHYRTEIKAREVKFLEPKRDSQPQYQQADNGEHDYGPPPYEGLDEGVPF